MSQTVPATAVLGPGLTGLTIGLRVLNLDGTEYAAFATTDVAETSVAGTYRKAGGVVVPDAGGYLVWGVSGTDYAEATVESTSANVTLWKGEDAGSAPLKPTVSGRTLDVSATGEAGLDFDNRKDTNGILPSDMAGSLGGLPVLDGNSLLPANVVRWDSNNMSGTLPALQGADGDTLETLSDQLDGVQSNTAAIMEDTGTTLPAAIAAAGGVALDTVLEETMTFGEALRIMLAALAGKTDGSGTPALSFYGQDGSTVRIAATVDGIGNRTALTLDGEEA